MSIRRSLRRTRSFEDADAVFILQEVAPNPTTTIVPALSPPAPVVATPLSPNARVLRLAVAPSLCAVRPHVDFLALAPPQVPLTPAPLMHHANIASYILFKLSINSENYSKWRQLLWYILCKYQVEDHVVEEVDPLHAYPTYRATTT